MSVDRKNTVRDKFKSRLGFILLSAGCAIGLGNIWRFPYITGQYGGGFFVLLYILFLAILGLPLLVMELSVGRASQKSIAKSFDTLEKEGTKWHLFKYIGMAGNYLLMMFYTTVGGFVLNYLFKMIKGDFVGTTLEDADNIFFNMTQSSVQTSIWTLICIAIGFLVCVLGLSGGMEKITKGMMISLLVLMVVLVIRSLTLDNVSSGLKFYLIPHINLSFFEISNTIFAAMGQAFFTLSIGIGSMAIFGSYLDKNRSLTGEAVSVAALDTIVALMSGLIIFPACFSYGINPESGPKLIFITLSQVFSSMPLGRLWGSLFFLFLSFASISTIIAVFENIVSFLIDLKGYSRKKSVAINLILVSLLSLPTALGFNLLSFIDPFLNGSTIMDLEDFILSNNIIVLGALVYLLFCTSKYGWGYDNFLNEANKGDGIKFPKWCKFYLSYILPILILIIFIQGYISKFFM